MSEKSIYTSNFASLAAIKKAGLKPIGIAISPPSWYEGRSLKQLAPRKEMLRMSHQNYNIEFAKILRDLSPRDVYDFLPDKACLLCYEKPTESCHRRAVAEWLEVNLGIQVDEFGYERQDYPKYSEMSWRVSKAPPKSEKAMEKAMGINYLF